MIYDGKQDSTSVNDGVFVFEGALDEPVKAYLVASASLREVGRNPRATFYLEPGTITVTVDGADMGTATFQGGPVNELYSSYEQLLEPVTQQSAALSAMYREAGNEERQTDAFQERYRKQNEAIGNLRQEVAAKFIRENPSSIVSLDAIIATSGFDPDISYVEPLFTSLSNELKQTNAGKKYAEGLETIRQTSVGALAPVFTQADTLGNPVSLTDLRGQYVLLDFWASWCGPCRVENPHVVAAFHKFKENGFTVLGVSLDDEKGRDAWMKAIQDDQLQDWPHLSDLQGWKNEAAQLYGVRGIPANYLLDPEGRIIAKNLRGQALEAKLAEVFGEE